ncbi:MAG: helix-turn-helix transcriptional regulator [Firmicutes bacterium]|nr:helix-turn-helix transcriptional regulator [Bacillota bacterium]
MTRAYSELYLDDAMRNLGDLFDYAVNELGYDPDTFFGWFVTSGIADQFGSGNPKYIVGMSGYELADQILDTVGILRETPEPYGTISKSVEYWAGWALAYYQWYSGRRFEDLAGGGLTLSAVCSMYILHEADLSKFVEAAETILARNAKDSPSPLQQIRKARGFTQQQLSDAAGVTLRMVQLYEQKQNDLGKAQAAVVLRLAKALGCEVEDLLQ